MADFEYSGQDYYHPACGKTLPLMVPLDALQGGSRFLMLRKHDKVDGTPCLTDDVLVKIAGIIPTESLDEP